MKTLRQVITEAVGENVADERYLKELGYDSDTLDDPALFIGYFKYSAVDVYAVSCGGWHLSGGHVEKYTENDPYDDPDFMEVDEDEI